MKSSKRLFGVMAIGLALALASPAMAVPYLADVLIGSANIKSGEATERNQFITFYNQLNGTNITAANVTFSKVETPNPGNVALANDNNSWYIDAPTTPGYFMLKFGGGSFPKDTDDHYYFQNIVSTTKLVWNNAQVKLLTGDGGNNTNIGRLSHYGMFNVTDCDGGGGTVELLPEPGNLSLMLIGFVGLFGSRRVPVSG